jgi:beta-N-acetylhexosaminidase
MTTSGNELPHFPGPRCTSAAAGSRRHRDHRRIRLYYLDTEGGGIHESNERALDDFTAELKRRRFEVTVNDGASRVEGGATVKDSEEVDAAIIMVDIVSCASEDNYRIRWKTPMSTD